MPITVPPWLDAPDLAGNYLKGLQIGSQVAEANARISAEQTRAQMEAQARQQTLESEHLIQQQRLATETAYRKTELNLQQARLAEVAKVNAAKTREAALVLADKQGFAADLAGGMPLEQALYRHPRISSPAAVESAQKAALDLGSQRLALRKSELDLRQQQEDRAAAKAAKPPELKGTFKDASGAEVAGPLNELQDQFGTNLPASMQRKPEPFVAMPKEALDRLQDRMAPYTQAVVDATNGKFSSPAEVKSAYSSGKLSREKARQILKEQFGFGVSDNASGD